jgi:hypothetical protein
MSFAVHCPECGSGLEVEEEHRDWTVRCPNCRHEFRPSAVAGAPAPPETFALQHDASPADDDDEPRPKRRRRRRDEDEDDEYEDQGHALRLVSGPATAIKVVAWLGIGLKILSVLLSIGIVAMMMGNPPAQRQNQNPNNGPFGNNAFAANDKEEAITNLVIAAIEAVIHIVVGVLMLIGAGKMSRLESHGWAQAAAILGMIPCISPCCLLGLPFGIWALNTINRPDVRRAFRQSRRYD